MTSKFTQSILEQKPGFDFVAAHFACENDLFSQSNPDGFVNFGSAQNFLQTDQRLQLLQSLAVDSEDARYQPFAGTESCRRAVAEYMQQITAAGPYFADPVDPAHVVLGNGVISLLEALTIALLDSGDKVLVPTPVFPGLVNAMSLRVKSAVHFLHTTEHDDFRLTPARLEAELRAQASAQKIRAVLLCSPGNPIGQVFSREELSEFLAIAQEFDCALIVDEVYAGSCLPDVAFCSAIELQSDHVYVLGGLSKDFGLAGFATGWLHVANDAVRKAVAKQSHFFRLPAPLLRMTEAVLQADFRDSYLKQHQRVLGDYFQDVTGRLRADQIAVTPTESGLCLWLDLRDYLQTQDADGEMRLYQSLLNDFRVHISPGAGFCTPSVGFFRICISQDRLTLDEGLARLAQGLDAQRSNSADAVLT
ncbi:MAG: pyridoxal phosphate-dependent aminotransferase [Fuerstiella sp.]